MKILHVPFCYFPDPAGGTEVYVASLSAAQRRLGIEPVVAAPGDTNDSYIHHGVRVHRFKISKSLGLRELYGEGDPIAASFFLEVLQTVRPDVVHLHAFTSGISVRLARKAASANLPVVFTYHTPTVTCTRGTLLRWGSEVCDGEMHAASCSACTLHANGLPRAVSAALARSPMALTRLAGDRSGGLWTALRMRELIELRHQAVRELFQLSTHIVAVCDWVYALLVRNGVPSDKITVSRQGLPYAPTCSTVAARRDVIPLRFAFLGRLDKAKGVEVLIDAFARLPSLPIRLDIYGVNQKSEGLVTRVRERAAADSRIQLRAPVAPDQVVRALREYDALLVPSQWLETGPLVVYEAFSAGIPVVGSRLGGIAELVADGISGVLVADPFCPSAWASVFLRLASQPEQLARLRGNEKLVRSSDDVALEMKTIYERILNLATAN